jgi:endonuclease VIII
MPEGPEIRRAADQLERAVAQQQLQGVYFKFPHLKQFEKKLAAAKIARFETRGKALLTHFDCGLSVYSHNQLYGVWRVVNFGAQPSGTRDLRFAIYGLKKSALLFSASDIDVLPSTALVDHPFLKKLGPDVLDRKLDSAALHERLSHSQFARKSLSALLLDQAFLAGMGNYLRSEVLFEAGVPPDLRAQDLSPEAKLRLAQALLDVAWRSYRSRGITNQRALDAGLRRTKKLSETAYEAGRFCVFGRDGLPCLQCGETILRLALAGRRLYYCPSCQV